MLARRPRGSNVLQGWPSNHSQWFSTWFQKSSTSDSLKVPKRQRLKIASPCFHNATQKLWGKSIGRFCHVSSSVEGFVSRTRLVSIRAPNHCPVRRTKRWVSRSMFAGCFPAVPILDNPATVSAAFTSPPWAVSHFIAAEARFCTSTARNGDASSIIYIYILYFTFYRYKYICWYLKIYITCTCKITREYVRVYMLKPQEFLYMKCFRFAIFIFVDIPLSTKVWIDGFLPIIPAETGDFSNSPQDSTMHFPMGKMQMFEILCPT